jgi:hypothetical protein
MWKLNNQIKSEDYIKGYIPNYDIKFTLLVYRYYRYRRDRIERNPCNNKYKIIWNSRTRFNKTISLYKYLYRAYLNNESQPYYDSYNLSRLINKYRSKDDEVLC